MTPAAGSLYFHSPCFDGIVSAVLAWDFVQSRRGWTAPELRAVNYDLRPTWLALPLDEPAAVVDFLYHPGAGFWADHHLTAFLTDAAHAHFAARTDGDAIYDPEAGSCAKLLWNELAHRFGHRNPTYAEMVEWAERIDAARYASVEEAMFAAAPALRLSRGLALGGADRYCENLVLALRHDGLEAVADLPEPRRRFERVRALMDVGLDRFKRTAHVNDDGVVVFDVDATDAIVSRYAPFHLFPGARYSAGIVRSTAGAKLTAMRNPWREFPSVPLGPIAESLGGGGHHRVAAVALRGERAGETEATLKRFVTELVDRDRALRRRSPP